MINRARGVIAVTAHVILVELSCWSAYGANDSTGWPTQAPRTVSPTHHELSPSSLCHFIFSAKRLVARKEANPPISTGNRRETRLAVNNQGERRWEVSLISRLSSVSALAWMRGLLGCRERDSYSIARNKTCPSCNQPMYLQSRSDVTDKNRFINHSKSLPGFYSSCMKVEVLQLQLPQVSWLA